MGKARAEARGAPLWVTSTAFFFKKSLLEAKTKDMQIDGEF
jgi:hypothetical protein